MSWDNNYEYGNDYNNNNDNNNLDNILGEDNQQNDYSQNDYSQNEDSNLENFLSDDSNSQDDHIDNTQYDKQEETQEDTEDSKENNISTIEDAIDNKIQKAPNNTSNEKEYSLKDIYKVYNVMIVLDSFGDEISDWVVSTLGISNKANKVRQAVDIASIEKSEFDAKTFAMGILKSIYEVDHPEDEENHDQVAATMDAINELINIDNDDKSTVISLIKGITKDIKGKKVNLKATRNSPETVIFSEIRELLNDNPEVSGQISFLNTALETLKDKAL